MGVASRRRPSVASRGWQEIGMRSGQKLGNWGLTPLQGLKPPCISLQTMRGIRQQTSLNLADRTDSDSK